MTKAKKIMAVTIAVITLMSMCIFLAPEKDDSVGMIKVEAATKNDLLKKQADLEKKQASLKSKLSSVRDKAASAQEELNAINDIVENLQDQVSTLNATIDVTEQEIKELDSEIAKRQVEIDNNYDNFKNRLRAMYMSGDITGGLEVLLSTDSYDNLLTRMYYIEKMAEHDQSIIDSITADKQTFEEQKIDVEAKRAKLAEQKKTLNAKKTELDEEKAEAQKIVKEIEKEQKALEEQQKKIDAQMDSAKRQLDALIKAETKKDVGSKYVGGGFKWPTPGYGTITSPYGMRWGKLHKGIDIGAPTGAKIVASNQGKVVTSTYQSSYGNYVIINHGGGYMTVYAHMSKRLVSVGTYVAKGQTIGKVGSTGHSTGPHLHFEIRVNGTAVNPRKYV